jgi:hypothetical protein
MKLITEQIEEIQVITESKNGKQNLYITGPFLQAEITNRNGRCYSYNILEREVNKYNDKYIKSGRALGELGHPEGPTVNLHRVSHMITSLVPEGKNFIGKAKILETPMGAIAKNLIEGGVKLGVSSRGVGSLIERGGVKYVGDDFMLSTAADIVADPSAPDAFVQGIMEGKEWAWNNGVLAEKTYMQLNSLTPTVDRQVREERIINLFDNFLRDL